MPTFGNRLRHERESRNTRIQDLSRRTRIGLHYLEALENNDFSALPGPRGFAKLYIRAYGDVLGFDPASLIEAFEQERRKQARVDVKPQSPAPARTRRIRYVPPPLKKPVDAEPEPESIAEPEPEPEPNAEPRPEPIAEPEPVETTEPPPSPVLEPAGLRTRWVIGLSLAAVVLLIATVNALRPEPATEAVESAATPIVVEPEPAVEEEATPAGIEPQAAPTVVPSGIHVTTSGVGSGIVDRRLVGEGTRFDEGSKVFFLTRVAGGGSGQRLRHVWLQDGKVIQSIELSPVRSPDWRTYSSKTLWRKGNWTVEARTEDDRVLARAEFTCVR